MESEILTTKDALKHVKQENSKRLLGLARDNLRIGQHLIRKDGCRDQGTITMISGTQRSLDVVTTKRGIDQGT